jgi:polar amino acid transport system substrate-binding protein
MTVAILGIPPVFAGPDTWDEIRRRGTLRWGGDEEGGAPYIVPGKSKETPDGFEGELIQAIARKWGVRAEFQQCQWDNLPDLLRSGGVDLICNGFELRIDRLRQFLSTIPYYVNELQLVGRRDDDRLGGWDDLRVVNEKRKWRIGVLADSAAERYLKDHFSESVDTINYPGTTQAFDHVRDRQLDATLTDAMAAQTYLPRYPELRPVGETVEGGHFVIYVRLDDKRLRAELNSTLRELLQEGTIQRLYEKYRIWNPRQKYLLDPETQSLPDRMLAEDIPPARWAMIREAIPSLLIAALKTAILSLVSMPLAMVIGLCVAIGRLYGPKGLRWILVGYVEMIRGTPLAMQLFLIFYVLPQLVPLPGWLSGTTFGYTAGILGLAINYSAYEAEIYRAGILAISRGQMEAGLALGMSRRQVLRYVIIPQAIRLVIPPVTSDFIALFKDTAVVQVITIVELSKQYAILANSTGLVLEFAAMTAALYLLMSLPLVLLSRRLERKPAVVHV